MADEQEKVAAPQPAPTTKGMLRHKGRLTDEQRRTQDALEDDDVRESLKQLHGKKARADRPKNGSIESGRTKGG